MPTFTAVALDRLLEPGTSRTVDKSIPISNPIAKPKSLPKTRHLPNSALEIRNSASATERKVSRPQISPALYATPEATPLPDSPSSFPPSPYIINHKRRGRRLLKSFFEDDVASHRKTLDDNKVNENAEKSENRVVDSTKDHNVPFSISDSVEKKHVNGILDSPIKGEIGNGAHETLSEREHMNGVHDGEIGSSNGKLKSRNTRNGLAMEKDVLKLVALNSERDGDSEDFLDPWESMSSTSITDDEGNSLVESSLKLAATTPVEEFYDAREELSSDSGRQTFIRDIEAEYREVRLNLLVEIEKRKQIEETLHNVQDQWQRIRQQLALEGFTLPALPIAVLDNELSASTDPAKELCQQLCVARFVSDSIGRCIAKAEAEMEKEAQIEAKNFEIAQLSNRLHYYETVNLEMSKRNQEAIEMSRRNRQVRKRRRRWVWGSIVAVMTVGAAALAWSYLPSGEGSSSTNDYMVPGHDDGAE